MSELMTIRVYHEQAQPEHIDKCKFSDCDHLCLPRTHYRLSFYNLNLIK